MRATKGFSKALHIGTSGVDIKIIAGQVASLSLMEDLRETCLVYR